MKAVAQRASALADAGMKPSAPSRFHAVAWRWHFYAGLYVVPFLLMLALTGLVMVFFTGFQTRLGPAVTVNLMDHAPLPVSAQAQAVLELRSQATLREYIAPAAPDRASWFVVARDGVTEAVAVDPYTAQVLQLVDKDQTWFAWAEKIHGTLLLGDVGDRLIEIDRLLLLRRAGRRTGLQAPGFHQHPAAGADAPAAGDAPGTGRLAAAAGRRLRPPLSGSCPGPGRAPTSCGPP